mmetsp:Transcript_19613/g.47467  ORF Transcript_19613/g.47467 Transcript_19613/m.47467 type:complete len:466 (-) Transcript_19613:68-1465(-)
MTPVVQGSESGLGPEDLSSSAPAERTESPQSAYHSFCYEMTPRGVLDTSNGNGSPPRDAKPQREQVADWNSGVWQSPRRYRGSAAIASRDPTPLETRLHDLELEELSRATPTTLSASNGAEGNPAGQNVEAEGSDWSRPSAADREEPVSDSYRSSALGDANDSLLEELRALRVENARLRECLARTREPEAQGELRNAPKAPSVARHLDGHRAVVSHSGLLGSPPSNTRALRHVVSRPVSARHAATPPALAPPVTRTPIQPSRVIESPRFGGREPSAHAPVAGGRDGPVVSFFPCRTLSPANGEFTPRESRQRSSLPVALVEAPGVARASPRSTQSTVSRSTMPSRTTGYAVQRSAVPARPRTAYAWHAGRARGDADHHVRVASPSPVSHITGQRQMPSAVRSHSAGPGHALIQGRPAVAQPLLAPVVAPLLSPRQAVLREVSPQVYSRGFFSGGTRLPVGSVQQW